VTLLSAIVVIAVAGIGGSDCIHGGRTEVLAGWLGLSGSLPAS
jgi:hypothetical protein